MTTEIDTLTNLLASLKERGITVDVALAQAETEVKMLKTLQRTMKAAEPPKPRRPRKAKEKAA